MGVNVARAIRIERQRPAIEGKHGASTSTQAHVEAARKDPAFSWFTKSGGRQGRDERKFDAVKAQLDAASVEWISIEDREKGTFGTFADPDGNYLQIIEWK